MEAGNRLDQISVICDEKMQPFVTWWGTKPMIFFQDPDDIKTISTFIEKPYFYTRFASILLGNGLVTAPGLIWKHTTKKLTGVFTMSVVNGYQGVFNAHARALVDGLRTKAGVEPFDAMETVALTTFGAISQTAMGVSGIADSVEFQKYFSAFNQFLGFLIARILNLLTYPDCVYKLTTAYRKQKEQVEVLHKVSDMVLKKRKAEREKMAETGKHDQTKDVKFLSVLDLLLDLGESDPLFSEQQIKSEINTILAAGHETVATGAYCTLLMIGCRPDVQDKLYKEMRSIFGDSTRPVENKDLARMVYCEAVVNETLRLYPPAPVVVRCADKEVRLKSCTVPIGSSCVLNVWGSGRSKRSWGSDALEYRPERWLDGDTPSTAAAFLPFCYGRRACIGKRYAIVILKTMLVYCVRELEFFSEADKMQFKVDVMLKPIAGHLIKIKLRNDKRTFTSDDVGGAGAVGESPPEKQR